MPQASIQRAGNTPLHRITDWDDAYANAANIPGSDRWPEAWIAPARAFRKQAEALLDRSYGNHPREKFDLFKPIGTAKGLVMFVHGGYWHQFDKSYWSHLSAGPVARGWAVAVPSYTLCPETKVTGIVTQIANALAVAATENPGPIRLCGHSAGGHLVTRLMCRDVALSNEVTNRMENVVSISGLHDLRPLLRTRINDEIRLTQVEASKQSPALQVPSEGIPLTCWVGQRERPEFLRQNELLANIWKGLGVRTQAVEEPNKHHFDVIDGLADADSPLTNALLSKT
ncbi:MAG: alpha/beta hydrolase [Paracoccaceae bacterium]